MIETTGEARSRWIHLLSLMLTMCVWEGHLESQAQQGQGHLSWFVITSGHTEDTCGISSLWSLAAVAVAAEWVFMNFSASQRQTQARVHTERVRLTLTLPAGEPSRTVVLWQKLLSLCLFLSACGSEGSLGHLSFLSFLEVLQNERKKKGLTAACRVKKDRLAFQFITLGLTSRKIVRPLGSHFQ